jgi:crossover junction endonuclease MUS81
MALVKLLTVLELIAGPGIAQKLEDKLRSYCTAQGLPMPEKPGHNTQGGDIPDAATGAKAGTKRRAPARQYIPKYRSGAWAILRALDTFPPDANVTKTEIIRVAHQYCDSSFDTPTDNQYYTAWSSVKTLLERGYVYKSGNPPRYCLTEEGAEIARTIASADKNGANAADGPSQKRSRPEAPATSAYIPPETLVAPRGTIARVPSRGIAGMPSSSTVGLSGSSSRHGGTLRPGTYTIQLVMDNREIHSQVDRDRLEREIGEARIPYSVKALDVGDALWIAKSGGEEYVLDYIIERKRMDDLVSSITDGRFHEQKVPNPLVFLWKIGR